MTTHDLLRTEIAHYQALAEQLRQDFADLDDETLADTLEGISDLPDLIQGLVRSSLADEGLIGALKTRLDDMAARRERLKTRFEKKRALVTWALGAAGIARLEAEDFSVCLRLGGPKLSVSDESRIPAGFFLAQPPKLDRAALALALKSGQPVPGATLVAGAPQIAVRTR